MPILKQISCAVQSVKTSSSGVPLPEHNTRYADGYVESYIAVPSDTTPFSIRLRSHGYIAPGLAMFVYMDGVYQCNRNRTDLKTPGGTTRKAQIEVDFHVRQKEEMLPDLTFHGKPWRFGMLNPVSNPDALTNIGAPKLAEEVGKIEVLVLRCLATEVPATTKSKVLKEIKYPAKPEYVKESESSEEGEDSPSSDESLSALGGMYDGSRDAPSKRDGKMARDKSSRYLDNNGAGPSSRNEVPQTWGSHDHTQDAYSHDWGNVGSEGNHHQRFPSAHVGFNPRREKNSSPHSKYPSEIAVDSSNKLAASCSPAVVININHLSPPSSINNGPPPRRDPATVSYDDDNDSDVDKYSKTKVHDPKGKKPPDDENKKCSNFSQVVPYNGNDDQSRQQSFHGSTRHTYPDTTNISGAESPKTAHQSMPGAWATPDPQNKGDDTYSSDDGSNSDPGSDDTDEPTQENGNSGKDNRNNSSNWDTHGNHPTSSGGNANNGGRWKDNTANPNTLGRDKRKGKKAKDKGSGSVWPNSRNQGHLKEWISNEKNSAQQGGWGDDNAANIQQHDGPTPPWNATDNSQDQGQTQDWDNNTNNSAEQNKWGGDTSGNTQPDKWGGDNSDGTQPYKWEGDNSGGTQADNWGGDNSGNTQADEWGGDKSGNTQADKWDDNSGKTQQADWTDNTQNQGQSQDWNSNEKSSEPKVSWADENNQQSENSQDSSQDQDQAGGGAVEDSSKWAEPSQPNHRNSAAGPASGAQSRPPVQSSIKDSQQGSEPGSNQPSWVPNGHSPNIRTPLSTAPKPKPYWAFWRQSNEVESKKINSNPANEPAYPLYPVPLEIALQKKTTHQVHVNQPAPYYHKTSSPMYMDSFENPYAVFVFHYRSKLMLEEMLLQKLEEPESEEERMLSGLSKEELIEKVLQAKASPPSKGPSFSGSSKSFIGRNSGKSDQRLKVNRNPPNPGIMDRDSDSASFTDPDHQLGRTITTKGSPPPIWNTSPPASHHEYVSDWLGTGNAKGGLVQSGGVPLGGSSQSNGNAVPAVKYQVANANGGPLWNGRVNWGGNAEGNTPATEFWGSGDNAGASNSNTQKSGSW